MRTHASLCLLFLCACPATPQNAAFPLESVAIDGSTIPKTTIIEIAGLRLGGPIDKAGLERASKALYECGLFASVSYRYAPGPKKGYALTLKLEDHAPLVAAAIDIPGADEDEAWKWLIARFQRFDHRIPQAEPAQNYLAGQLEGHLAGILRGQRLVTRMETDFYSRRTLLSFQPETLPRIAQVDFTGNHSVPSAELHAALDKIVLNEGYTERSFANLVDQNLRRLYERRGLYRVRFAPGRPRITDEPLALTVAIDEGEPYTLGRVEIAGADLPADAMLRAARFPTEKLANWQQIQEGIWEAEKVVKRTGFYAAAARAERLFDDPSRVLNLRLTVAKGPLFRMGQVRFTGLTPDQEASARAAWKRKPGDSFDYAYSSEYELELLRILDTRKMRKVDVKEHIDQSTHVVDFDIVFVPR